ncbi:MAG: hypothetical protein AAGC68_17985, partial [Verrucomicrobiota bacterium]
AQRATTGGNLMERTGPCQRNRRIFTICVIIVISGFSPCPRFGLEAQELDPDSTVPELEAVEASDFDALTGGSPFSRVLDPAETYVLKGIASLDKLKFATVLNRKTKKTHLVTQGERNEEGIELVEVVEAEGLEGVSAKVSFAGDEVELKYETNQIAPGPDARPGPGRGPPGGKDGQRRGPSKEDVERFRALGEEKQKKLREYIGHVMRSYPNLSREERGNMIRGAMIRLSDGRELEVPQAPAGGGGGQPPTSGGRR